MLLHQAHQSAAYDRAVGEGGEIHQMFTPRDPEPDGDGPSRQASDLPDPLADVRIFTQPERRWLVLKDGLPLAGSAAG